MTRASEVSWRMTEFAAYGVGSDCQRFRERCCKVLTSLGIDATYDLRHITSHAKLTPPHRRQLEALIDGLDDSSYTPVNPIPGLFRALLALIATSFDGDEVIRAVGIVADLIGRKTVAGALMDELCDRYHDRRDAIKLIDAIASIRDALSPRHYDYLRQIAFYGPREIEWRSKKLLGWIGELGPDNHEITIDDSDAGCCGLKLLGWLERAAVVGPDTRITNPGWIWLRDFRYQPRIVNHGPMLAYRRSPETSVDADSVS